MPALGRADVRRYPQLDPALRHRRRVHLPRGRVWHWQHGQLQRRLCQLHLRVQDVSLTSPNPSVAPFLSLTQTRFPPLGTGARARR